MDIFGIISVLLTLTALFSYINYKFLKLPATIGVMLISLVISLSLILISGSSGDFAQKATLWLNKIDFDYAVMQGMLSFLLFAGALHVNINDLAKEKLTITLLATLGVVLSTFIFGSLFYLINLAFGFGVDFIYCLLFGSIISPTDPIAVLGILKTTGAPKDLETVIAGESLFNDGIGVVVFLVISGIAFGGGDVSFTSAAWLFTEEAVGGALLGIILGWTSYYLLKSIDNYQVEALITLALVMGGYKLASSFHMSGPIAIVVAGLFIGNKGRNFAMSDNTRNRLDDFWELIDEILNSILFVLIGLELLVLTLNFQWFAAGLIVIPLVLLSRFVSVSLPLLVLKFKGEKKKGLIPVLTWGGLRGGISVALALSLPPSAERDIILVFTYIVVIFSISVQGLSIKKLVNKVINN